MGRFQVIYLHFGSANVLFAKMGRCFLRPIQTRPANTKSSLLPLTINEYATPCLPCELLWTVPLPETRVSLTSSSYLQLAVSDCVVIISFTVKRIFTFFSGSHCPEDLNRRILFDFGLIFSHRHIVRPSIYLRAMVGKSTPKGSRSEIAAGSRSRSTEALPPADAQRFPGLSMVLSFSELHSRHRGVGEWLDLSYL